MTNTLAQVIAQLARLMTRADVQGEKSVTIEFSDKRDRYRFETEIRQTIEENHVQAIPLGPIDYMKIYDIDVYIKTKEVPYGQLR